MNLTNKIFRIFSVIFIAQVILVLSASWIYFPFKENSLSKRTIGSLTKVDSAIVEGIILQNQIGNHVARDLLTYRLLELNGLDSSSFLALTNLKEITDSLNLKDCTEYEQSFICFRKTSAVGLIPLKVDNTINGFLKLELSLQKSATISRQYIFTILTTLFIIFVINAVSLFFIWWKFLKPETLKLLKVFQTDFEDVSIEIKEFRTIQDSYLREIAKNKKTEEEKLKLEKNLERINLATQVAHDIRSPLETLKSVEPEIACLPRDTQDIVRLSIKRLEEITSDLLFAHRHKKYDDLTEVDLSSLLEELITEKKAEFRKYKNVKIEFCENGLIKASYLDKIKMKSIISNLMNNALESLPNQSGTITIQLFEDKSHNVIEVKDNGNGIPAHVALNLFTKGFSTKQSGNGLGLYNAKKEIELIRGKIEFMSELDLGTTFKISIPKSEVYKNNNEINLSSYDEIIILDDDKSIHEFWRKKLKDSNKKIRYYDCPKFMMKEHQGLPETCLLLSDYDLTVEGINGLNLIHHYRHYQHSIIFSGRQPDYILQEECFNLRVAFIPKKNINDIILLNIIY